MATDTFKMLDVAVDKAASQPLVVTSETPSTATFGTIEVKTEQPTLPSDAAARALAIAQPSVDGRRTRGTLPVFPAIHWVHHMCCPSALMFKIDERLKRIAVSAVALGVVLAGLYAYLLHEKPANSLRSGHDMFAMLVLSVLGVVFLAYKALADDYEVHSKWHGPLAEGESLRQLQLILWMTKSMRGVEPPAADTDSDAQPLCHALVVHLQARGIEVRSSRSVDPQIHHSTLFAQMIGERDAAFERFLVDLTLVLDADPKFKLQFPFHQPPVRLVRAELGLAQLLPIFVRFADGALAPAAFSVSSASPDRERYFVCPCLVRCKTPVRQTGRWTRSRSTMSTARVRLRTSARQ